MTAAPATNGDALRLGVLDQLVGYHLRRASSVLASDFARAVAGTGMRPVLFGILSVIAANPGMNQGAAGRMLGIQRANMVSLVTDLVERGLIQRETAADDRRAFALCLTPAGTAMVADCLVRIRTHEDRLCADLTTAERATLVRLLTRIDASEDRDIAPPPVPPIGAGNDGGHDDDAVRPTRST